MGKYQLTISPNYVPGWGCNEALRELVQNGIDRENEDSECKFFISYSPMERRLILGNPDTTLSKNTLLLGETTKDGKTTIGKYGEGYKLATLVLLRIGCRITIENCNEVWLPHMVKSKVFGCELLQIDTTKNPNNDGWLRYLIDGITPEQYSEFQDLCLIFHSPEKITTSYGDILMDSKFSGKVFYNTLYVCNLDNLQYGYNMKPEYIQLDRDRKKVTEFNLSWETSRMWAGLNESQKINNMIIEKKLDVEWYNTHKYANSATYKEICELQYKQFLETHGTNAVVCKDKAEADLIKAKYGNLVPVIVPEIIHEYISHADSYQAVAPDIRNEHTPENWLREHFKRADAPDETHEVWADALLTEAEKWVYRG